MPYKDKEKSVKQNEGTIKNELEPAPGISQR